VSEKVMVEADVSMYCSECDSYLNIHYCESDSNKIYIQVDPCKTCMEDKDE
jgi:formate dehydrogenase maturation protein FdhE